MSFSSFGRRVAAGLCLSSALGTAPGCIHEPPGTILNAGGAAGSSAGTGAAGNGAISGAAGSSGSGAGAGGVAGLAGAAGSDTGGAGASAAGADAGGAPAGASGAAGNAGAGQGGQSGAAAGSAGASQAGGSGMGAAGGPACGGKYCAADEYCCNTSCGTCAPRGQGCLADPCARMRCGGILCQAGSSCCSASCEQCGSSCGAITICAPDCAPMDAHFQGEDSRSLGWFWDGSACVDHLARTCSGADCGNGFTLQSECEAAFAGCLD